MEHGPVVQPEGLRELVRVSRAFSEGRQDSRPVRPAAGPSKQEPDEALHPPAIAGAVYILTPRPPASWRDLHPIRANRISWPQVPASA